MHNNGYYESVSDVNQKVGHILIYHTSVPMHFHDCLEIIMCVKGSTRIQTPTHTVTLNANEGMFLPPFCPHSLASVEPSATETMMIRRKYLNEFSAEYNNLSFPKLDNIEANVKILQLFHEFRDIQHNEDRSLIECEILIRGIVNHMLGIIVTHYTPYRYDKVDSLITDITQYVNENFTRKITLEEIATHFGYNKSYFSRMFHRIFGCSLTHYINTVRYNFISENSADGKITNLIFDSGFATTSSFYRYKKSVSKKSPE